MTAQETYWVFQCHNTIKGIAWRDGNAYNITQAKQGIWSTTHLEWVDSLCSEDTDRLHALQCRNHLLGSLWDVVSIHASLNPSYQCYEVKPKLPRGIAQSFEGETVDLEAVLEKNTSSILKTEHVELQKYRKMLCMTYMYRHKCTVQCFSKLSLSYQLPATVRPKTHPHSLYFLAKYCVQKLYVLYVLINVQY